MSFKISFRLLILVKNRKSQICFSSKFWKHLLCTVAGIVEVKAIQFLSVSLHSVFYCTKSLSCAYLENP